MRPGSAAAVTATASGAAPAHPCTTFSISDWSIKAAAAAPCARVCVDLPPCGPAPVVLLQQTTVIYGPAPFGAPPPRGAAADAASQRSPTFLELPPEAAAQLARACTQARGASASASASCGHTAPAAIAAPAAVPALPAPALDAAPPATAATIIELEAPAGTPSPAAPLAATAVAAVIKPAAPAPAPAPSQPPATAAATKPRPAARLLHGLRRCGRRLAAACRQPAWARPAPWSRPAAPARAAAWAMRRLTNGR